MQCDKPLYIVAVSGGVDSVVLLHQLVQRGDARLIVAHVDHGIRPESSEDADFVARLAAGYGVGFEQITLKLGPSASEALARARRWEFLRKLRVNYKRAVIVTAHHDDDVIETMIINLMRGTGWRGLVSLRETDEIKRPLLGWRKSDILSYARLHHLRWREDATNADPRYLRNYIRQEVMPLLGARGFQQFLRLYHAQLILRREIEAEMAHLPCTLGRYELSMLPDEVAYEIMRLRFGPLEYAEQQRVLLFARVGRPGKKLMLTSGNIIHIDGPQLIVLRE